MKKFIAFMVIALPLTAILSMAAGFYYAANTRRVPAGMDAPARIVATQAPIVATAVPAMPSATPKSDMDTSEYASRVRIAISGCASGLLKIGDLFGNPQIKSESWRIRMDTALRGIDECVRRTRAERPPEMAKAQDIYADAIALADEFEAVSKGMRAGMEAQNLSQMTDASDRYLRIGQLIDLLDAKIDAVQ